jgi:hypothetical protein
MLFVCNVLPVKWTKIHGFRALVAGRGTGGRPCADKLSLRRCRLLLSSVLSCVGNAMLYLGHRGRGETQAFAKNNSCPLRMSARLGQYD